MVASETGFGSRGIFAVTLFADKLDATKTFYQNVLELSIEFEDENSAVFNFGNILINLLDIEEAAALIGPAKVAAPNAGSRMQLTIQVEDVDAMCEMLVGTGVALLNGPMDRHWGIRTAACADPAGNGWEIAR